MEYLGFAIWIIGCVLVGVFLGPTLTEGILGSIGLALAVAGALMFWGL